MILTPRFHLASLQCLFETKVTIGVYYESLCPDSRNFITKQLYPTYQKLGQNLDVEFRPFGKASVRNGRWPKYMCFAVVFFFCNIHVAVYRQP